MGCTIPNVRSGGRTQPQQRVTYLFRSPFTSFSFSFSFFLTLTQVMGEQLHFIIYFHKYAPCIPTIIYYHADMRPMINDVHRTDAGDAYERPPRTKGLYKTGSPRATEPCETKAFMQHTRSSLSKYHGVKSKTREHHADVAFADVRSTRTHARTRARTKRTHTSLCFFVLSFPSVHTFLHLTP